MLSDSALLWTRIAAGVFLVLAANAAYGVWLARKKARGGGRWPVAPGEIVASDVHQAATHSSDEDADCDDKGRERTETRYRAAIRFAYRVGEREFHSSHWSWGWTALHAERASAQTVVDRYPAGKEFPVHYDPAQPETAVLDPTNKSGVAAPLLVGLFCILAGTVFLWAFTHVQ